MADNPENGSPGQGDAPAPVEHLNIKVTDNNNEVFFKIKRSTKLEKLMLAFCERQGKSPNSVRFLFEGQRVQPTDTPDTVRDHFPQTWQTHMGWVFCSLRNDGGICSCPLLPLSSILRCHRPYQCYQC